MFTYCYAIIYLMGRHCFLPTVTLPQYNKKDIFISITKIEPCIINLINIKKIIVTMRVNFTYPEALGELIVLAPCHNTIRMISY